MEAAAAAPTEARALSEECKNNVFKLFGVEIVAGKHVENGTAGVDNNGDRRSAAENDESVANTSSDGSSANHRIPPPSRRRSVRVRRKPSTPWTVEEHHKFLEGLQELGKGDWKGISKYFVVTRTPVQIASHAQKYFQREALRDKKKRLRHSLFDMPLKQSTAKVTKLPPGFWIYCRKHRPNHIVRPINNQEVLRSRPWPAASSTSRQVNLELGLGLPSQDTSEAAQDSGAIRAL